MCIVPAVAIYIIYHKIYIKSQVIFCMVTNLQLIRNQKAAASLFTIGSALLIVTSNLDFYIEVQKTNGINVKYTPSPAQITAFSFWIITIGGFIGAVTATIRLNQLIQKSRLGTKKPSIRPSIWIFAGSWLIFFGLFVVAIGSQQSVNEEEEIVVF